MNPGVPAARKALTCFFLLSYHLVSARNIQGLEGIKLEYSLRLKINRNYWLLADMCPQAANHCALF